MIAMQMVSLDRKHVAYQFKHAYQKNAMVSLSMNAGTYVSHDQKIMLHLILIMLT